MLTDVLEKNLGNNTAPPPPPLLVHSFVTPLDHQEITAISELFCIGSFQPRNTGSSFVTSSQRESNLHNLSAHALQLT